MRLGRRYTTKGKDQCSDEHEGHEQAVYPHRVISFHAQLAAASMATLVVISLRIASTGNRHSMTSECLQESDQGRLVFRRKA